MIVTFGLMMLFSFWTNNNNYNKKLLLCHCNNVIQGKHVLSLTFMVVQNCNTCSIFLGLCSSSCGNKGEIVWRWSQIQFFFYR